MLKNYIKIAYRNILKNKIHTFINVFGLGIGIGCTVLIMQWVQDELSYDRFHTNIDDLYVATFDNRSTVTPSALGPNLKSEYPEVVNTARFLNLGRNLTKSNNTNYMFDYNILADPDFINMFDINFLKGDKNTALNEPRSIIISEDMAQIVFKDQEPMNQILSFVGKYDVKVTGIFKNYPRNSHIRIDCILPMLISKEWSFDLNEWGTNNFRTYVQLSERTDPSSVEAKIHDIIQKRKAVEKRVLGLQAITRMHLYNYKSPGGLITYIYIFSSMAFFILIIACINFMNLTTAKSFSRSKEVGVRKAVGANKKELVFQFFTESMILVIIALFIGVSFVVFSLPTLNSLTGKTFTLAFLLKSNTILGMLGITTLTGIIACSYPSLFLSSFEPVKALKGDSASGTKGSLLRKSLVVFQFSLSIFLILGTLVISRQINYMQTKDLGFNKDNVIITNVGTRYKESAETIKSELLANPQVLSISMMNVAPFRWNANAGEGDVYWDGKTNQEVSMVFSSVDEEYINVFDLSMAQGRFFSKDHQSDPETSWVINEAAVRAMEIESPLGKNLKIWEEEGVIIGIVKDYHFESLHRKIIPMAMRINRDWNYSLAIKIDPNNVKEAISIVESKMNEIYPDRAFEYSFLNENIERQYRKEKEIGKIYKYFTFLAIIISCLGLFGLASFTAQRRTKEIGIRKIIGASSPGLIFLIIKDFIKWVLYANIIAWPVAWYAMDKWLQDFPFRIELSIDLFVLSGLTALVIAVVTVLSQSIKATNSNPVNSLRYE